MNAPGGGCPLRSADDPLVFAAEKLFGLSYLFPYQRLVITNLLEAARAAGISVKAPLHEGGAAGTSADKPPEERSRRGASGRQIVILPTGAGKSLCFQLPAMLIDGVTLVIYPLLSLMADQARRLRERGFSPVIIRGGQTKEERGKIRSRLDGGQVSFIIANPEVLNTAQVKTLLKDVRVTHVVIDEAHCVSEWGESFRPGYLQIGGIIETLGNPPLVTAFTATAGAPVLEKIRKYIFSGAETLQIRGNPDRPNISYSAEGCVNRNLAVRDLLTQSARPAIVFCSSRPGAEKLARYLRNELGEMGFAWHREIRFYHAGLSKEEKAALEKWFIGSREGVLVSTCAFGMGVDKADIRTVIHRDCAPSVEAYLQESGRAGRDGEQSKAVLLFGPDDEALAGKKTEAERGRFTAMLNYARDTGRCRRHSLLAMLDYDADGEVPEKQCCDVCEDKASPFLREELSVYGFFCRNKRRFTAEKAASVLAESETVRWQREDAANVIDFLLKTGKLKKEKNFFWKNKITVKTGR